MSNVRTNNGPKLPSEEKQAFKFHHLRYKIFPRDCSDFEAEQFFKEVGLPTLEMFSNEEFVHTEGSIVAYGGITAAYKLGDAEGDVAKVGITKCSLQDPYQKDIGRLISVGRYKKAEEIPDKIHEGVLFINMVENNFNRLTPFSATVRNQIIDEVNSGEMKVIESDFSKIRSFVASKTKHSFYVELS